MTKETHQLFTLNWIYSLAYFWVNYTWQGTWLFQYGQLIQALPLIAIPYIIFFTILPDGDTKWRVTKIWFLKPWFYFLRLFTKHRGFTHRIEWIFVVWLLLYLLSQTEYIQIYFIPLILLSINVIWVIVRNIWIKKFLIALLVIFCWSLYDINIMNGLLIACFIAYVWHMIWDALSTEWWTIIKFWKEKLKFQLPKLLSFNVWWNFEVYLLRPALYFMFVSYVLLNREQLMGKVVYEMGIVANIIERML